MAVKYSEKIVQDCKDALASSSVVFSFLTEEKNPFAALLVKFLEKVLAEDETSSVPDAFAPSSGSAADSIGFANEISRVSGRSFARKLDSAIIDAMLRLAPDWTVKDMEDGSSDENFIYLHARRFAGAFKTLFREYASTVTADGNGGKNLSRLRPSVVTLSSVTSIFCRGSAGAAALECSGRKSLEGVFGASRVFRYSKGAFTPLKLDTIRRIDDFYGFRTARRTFLEHYEKFSAGKGNLPLLISGLPGQGKTQMSIAYSLNFENITLVLPSPEDLSTGLEGLIGALAPYTDKKFMLFFDDIDAAKTDWYYFRANVGGAFSLPQNIAITIASNQRFPANVSSRGRGFVFPVFDEICCQEMIYDFLLALGMKEPTGELVSVIASDYVEEFGQKMFEELSPRTLVRYLDVYRRDKVKRKKMMESSKGELITRPDSQVFYDENMKLMRSLYGDAAQDEFNLMRGGANAL